MRWNDVQPGDLVLVQSISSIPDGLIFVIGSSDRYSGILHKYMNVVFFPAKEHPQHINLSVGNGRIDHTNLKIIVRRNG